ncbi:MAG: hypothetical protein OEW59_04715, partial [Gammaproteobacteria bacterium]|nr:hypothetical protein [Gammaproteobacteria bacterium]
MSRLAGTGLLPVAVILAVTVLTGCAAQVPKAALRLEESTLEVRAAQTRTMAAPSETAILTATIAVLQDMEFNIDRIEKPLGVITASKVSDADDAGEKATLFILDMLCAASMSGGCDNMSKARDDQHIMLTTVVLPSLGRPGEYTVRVTLQRIVYDKEDRVLVMERIGTPEIYQ